MPSLRKRADAGSEPEEVRKSKVGKKASTDDGEVKRRKTKLQMDDRKWYDILVLVKMKNPWDREHGGLLKVWKDVANEFNERHRIGARQMLDGRQARIRVEGYLEAFQRTEAASLKKTGANEDYTELMELCTELVVMRDQAMVQRAAQVMVKVERLARMEEEGSSLRGSAMNMEPKKISKPRTILDDLCQDGDEKDPEVAHTERVQERRFNDTLTVESKAIFERSKHGKDNAGATLGEAWFRDLMKERMELEHRRFTAQHEEARIAREQREALLAQTRKAAEDAAAESREERALFRQLLLNAMAAADSGKGKQ